MYAAQCVPRGYLEFIRASSEQNGKEEERKQATTFLYNIVYKWFISTTDLL